MNKKTPSSSPGKLSDPRRVNVGALIVAAAGILIISASAPERFPSVPPGPIILTVAAGIVAFAPGRWTPVMGMVVPLIILVGGIFTGELADLLSDPDNAGVLTGGAIQLLAILTAIATGAIASAQNRRGSGVPADGAGR
jgi:hypothetical protein